ncbi:hypothetical protein HN51_041758 [Arachis hypogaea]
MISQTRSDYKFGENHAIYRIGIFLNVAFNNFQYAADSLPFGGVGENEFGMYHEKFSFDTFSSQKAVVRRSFLTDFWYRYSPWTLNKFQLLEVSYNYDYLGLLLVLIGLKTPSKHRSYFANLPLITFTIISIIIYLFKSD